jgi:glycosyltransferase
MESLSLKVSVVTVTLNSASTVGDTLRSIACQSYPDIEHIIVDGLSSDATIETIKSGPRSPDILVSEPDCGIYDAMNKGLYMASGDIVCFLNSDDVYSSDNILQLVAEAFADPRIDFVYGNIRMIAKRGKALSRVSVTGRLPRTGLKYGLQIPHPAFFVRAPILRGLGEAFDTQFKIAADLKQQLQIVHLRRSTGFYLNEYLADVKLGGASTASFSSYFTGWREARRAYNLVLGAGGLFYVVFKVLRKSLGLRIPVFRGSTTDF